MVEMEMRADDQVDIGRIAADRLEACTDLLAGREADLEQAGEAGTEAASRIVLAIRVEPGVEQRPSFRMLDQKHRHRHCAVALAALHQPAELARYPAAGNGVDL